MPRTPRSLLPKPQTQIEFEILDEVRIKREDVIANEIIEDEAALLRRRQREMRERLGDLGADADKAADSRRQLSAAANQQAGDRPRQSGAGGAVGIPLGL